MTGTVVLKMPWKSPPLRSNSRGHWAKLNRKRRDIRADVRWIASSQRRRTGTIKGPVTVRFVWVVNTNHTRDAGASSPTLKAALDGIVDAGLLPSDDHTVVTSEICTIEHSDRPGCRIEITPTEGHP